ncbi:MAG: hypothetical protein CL398_10045 [Acidiferrobacteraceae bacterium]|nr:hypothetical protein [Acidiferrobacteraceae bacterium]|tara:strand:+ start:2171 stop:2689 length:519 start_codon:yes stop_codon:yes gene_type:complete
MSRGFSAAYASVSRRCDEPEITPSVILRTASNAFVEATGGASGLLFSTILKELGTACKNSEFLDATIFEQGLSASVVKIMQIGKVQMGDKTLLDSLAPAAIAASAKVEYSLLDCVTASAAASERGALTTQSMSAKKGRGRYVPDGGKGHIDPGAKTVAYIIKILRQQLETAK